MRCWDRASPRPRAAESLPATGCRLPFACCSSVWRLASLAPQSPTQAAAFHEVPKPYPRPRPRPAPPAAAATSSAPATATRRTTPAPLTTPASTRPTWPRPTPRWAWCCVVCLLRGLHCVEGAGPPLAAAGAQACCGARMLAVCLPQSAVLECQPCAVRCFCRRWSLPRWTSCEAAATRRSPGGPPLVAGPPLEWAARQPQAAPPPALSRARKP